MLTCFLCSFRNFRNSLMMSKDEKTQLSSEQLIPSQTWRPRGGCFVSAEVRYGKKDDHCVGASNLSWAGSSPWMPTIPYPWNRKPSEAPQPSQSAMEGLWLHAWVQALAGRLPFLFVLHTVDVFVGLTPALPLNLSLPHSWGHFCKEHASQCLQNLGSFWESRALGQQRRRGSYVHTAEDDFSTEFI